MNHLNRLRRKLHRRIQFGDGGIVPELRLAQENIREHRSREPKLPGRIGQVIHDGNANEDGRQFEHRESRTLYAVFRNRRIAAAQVAHACKNLASAFGSAFGKIAQLCFWMFRMVSITPGNIQRLRKAGTRGHQSGRRLRLSGGENA